MQRAVNVSIIFRYIFNFYPNVRNMVLGWISFRLEKKKISKCYRNVTCRELHGPKFVARTRPAGSYSGPRPTRNPQDEKKKTRPESRSLISRPTRPAKNNMQPDPTRKSPTRITPLIFPTLSTLRAKFAFIMYHNPCENYEVN